jgi:hypothetical protein
VVEGLFFAGLEDLAYFGVDEMNPPATGARHGFISLSFGQMIGSPALYLLAGSWAAVDERDHSKTGGLTKHTLPQEQSRRASRLPMPPFAARGYR